MDIPRNGTDEERNDGGNGSTAVWLDLDAAAEVLGVSPKTLRRWAKAGFITHYRIGESERQPGMIRFKAGDLEAYLDSHRRERVV